MDMQYECDNVFPNLFPSDRLDKVPGE